MNINEVTPGQLEERKAAVKKRPRESDFIGKPGYSRTYNDDGSYSWRYQFRPNDGHGKPTREGAEAIEMMRPSIAADTERNAKLQARIPRAKLVDQDGGVQFVDAAKADVVAQRNGWRHRWRAGGRRVERGPDGMLFAWDSHGRAWEPLGVRCLGTPLRGGARVSRRGLQRDPDGMPWRWIAGEWRSA
jgi:hypothetical protein